MEAISAAGYPHMIFQLSITRMSSLARLQRSRKSTVGLFGDQRHRSSTLYVEKYREKRNVSGVRGRSQIPSRVTRPFFDSDLPPPPSSSSLFLEFQRVMLFFTAVRVLPVYFGLASRSIFAVRDCVTLETFLRLTTLPQSRVTQFVNGPLP